MKFKKFIRNEEVSSSDVGEQPTEVTIDNGAVTKEPTTAPIESIRMDVELFIRVMEYAHEDAKTDQEIHQLTERAASMSRDRILTMEDYEALVAELRQSPDDPNAAPPKQYATMKTDPAYDSDKPTDTQNFGGGALSGM